LLHRFGEERKEPFSAVIIDGSGGAVGAGQIRCEIAARSGESCTFFVRKSGSGDLRCDATGAPVTGKSSANREKGWSEQPKRGSHLNAVDAAYRRR
jgi:hypothetical protein